jgi:hypothetical protein
MRLTVQLFLLVLLLPMLVPAAARATPKSPLTAAVTMGDSYISGEAGRWAGNSIDQTAGNDGTDRACLPAGSPFCQVDTSKVYLGDSDSDGCHRSDTSELLSAKLPVDRRFNIACSGAVASDLLRASTGGTSDHGEAPQGDQLGPLAKGNDIKLITVAVGGNDFGFASIVSTCFEDYTAMRGPCEPTEQPKIAAAAPGVVAKVSKTLSDIRAVMGANGYANSDYRLIVQTYPSVAPRAADGRYGTERTAHGCPFYDSDADWARDHAVFEIGDAVKAAARQNHAEVLDVGNAFEGHEFCSKNDRQATATDHPDAAHSEWGRIITLTQGQTQELFHPNAYGQMALGTCLTDAAAGTPGEFSCTGRAAIAPTGLAFKRTGSGSVIGTGTAGLPRSPMKIAVSKVKLARNRQTCVKFHVTSNKRSVKAALVRFVGRKAHTGRLGHATFCAKLSAVRHPASATKAGFTTARTSLKLKALRLRLVGSKPARKGRVCVTLGVRSGKTAVKTAIVKFFGHQAHTGRKGRATICAKLTRGRHVATARRSGYLIASFTITVRKPRLTKR